MVNYIAPSQIWNVVGVWESLFRAPWLPAGMCKDALIPKGTSAKIVPLLLATPGVSFPVGGLGSV